MRNYLSCGLTGLALMIGAGAALGKSTAYVSLPGGTTMTIKESGAGGGVSPCIASKIRMDLMNMNRRSSPRPCASAFL